MGVSLCGMIGTVDNKMASCYDFTAWFTKQINLRKSKKGFNAYVFLSILAHFSQQFFIQLLQKAEYSNIVS